MTIWRSFFLFLLVILTSICCAQSIEVTGKVKLQNPPQSPLVDSFIVVNSDNSMGLRSLASMKSFRVSETGDSLWYGTNKFVLVPNISAHTYPSVDLRIAKGQSPSEILGAGVPIDSLYGKKIAGGLFFYYDPVLKMSLLMSDAVFLDRKWGCNGVFIGTTIDSLGSGFENTADILNNGCSQQNEAPYLAGNLIWEGFNDWYLPSIQELKEIKKNLFDNVFGNLSGSGQYWSSFEFGMFKNTTFNFNSNSSTDTFRNTTNKIVAVRRYNE